MSLATNIQDLATRIATEVKALRTLINGNAADLSALATTDKTNLVNAINEVHDSAANASGIDDTTTTTGSTWSSSKINTEITDSATQTKNDILGGAGPAYDTLLELQNAIQNDDSEITAINTALGNRLRVDAAQGLTTTQQAQGRTNLDVYGTTDIGDPTTNYVTTFEAGLV